MFGPDFWNINFGNLIQIVVIAAGIIGMYYGLRNELNVVGKDIDFLKQGQKALNEAFTQLGNILTKVAVQDTRLAMMEKNLDELRHGNGYVMAKK